MYAFFTCSGQGLEKLKRNEHKCNFILPRILPVYACVYTHAHTCACVCTQASVCLCARAFTACDCDYAETSAPRNHNCAKDTVLCALRGARRLHLVSSSWQAIGITAVEPAHGGEAGTRATRWCRQAGGCGPAGAAWPLLTRRAAARRARAGSPAGTPARRWPWPSGLGSGVHRAP